jgi:hypothetical protein
MGTTDSQRLTVTPASPEASDALPGTPLPHAEKRARWALAGVLGPGAPRSSRKASPLSPTEADKPGVGPLAWPARRTHGPLRRAGSRFRSRSAMASASSNRIVKRMHKTGFGLGRPATLGLRLSCFRGFPLSGNLLARGMACRGWLPADADAHRRRPSGGRFRRASRKCCSRW